MAAAHHAVVFAWPEQGHINPAMAIADYLAASGILVTFVLTERSKLLQEQEFMAGRPNLSIHIVPDDSPLSDHSAAQKGLDHLLSKLMQCHPRPSCLLVDTLFCWAHLIASRHSLPRIQIWTASASAFTTGLHIPALIAKGYLPISHTDDLEKTVDFIPGLTPFRMADMPSIFTMPDIESPIFKFFSSVVEHSSDADRVLAHTIYEVERGAVDALQEHAGIRMDPIGPQITSSPRSLRTEDPACLSWLDKQEKASVLYIAFGSMAVLKEEVLLELAHGLVASGQPFLWVIRPENGANALENPIEGLLPKAITMLISLSKAFITSWAPQIEVLGHPSVGAFLSHCGWNSTLESLHLGVPILGFPQGGEQPMNLKYIVHDWKVGLALQEGENKGAPLHRNHVEKLVKAIMIGDEGKQVRKCALEWAKLAQNALCGSSKNNLERLRDDIKQGHLKASKPVT